MSSYLLKMSGIALVATGLFAGGYFTGRAGKSVTTAETTHKEDTHTANNSTTDSSHTTTTQEPKIVTRWRTIVEPAPGCVGQSKTTTEGEKTETATTKTETGTTKDTKVATTDTHVSDTTKTKTVSAASNRPGWLFSVRGGVSLPGLWGGTTDRQLVPVLPAKFAGSVSIERRLFGNLYTGAWVNSAGAVGLGVTYGF